jgi:hypothetical protein
MNKLKPSMDGLGDTTQRDANVILGLLVHLDMKCLTILAL